MTLTRGLRATLLTLALLPVAQAFAPPAQAPVAVPSVGPAERYDKREVLIPMRDGVKLFTAIYTPKDPSRTYPILLQRTPYSVYPTARPPSRITWGPPPASRRRGSSSSTRMCGAG